MSPLIPMILLLQEVDIVPVLFVPAGNEPNIAVGLRNLILKRSKVFIELLTVFI